MVTSNTKKEETVSVGLDEAGRGAWAGPIVGAAAFVPEDFPPEILNELKDSKKILEAKREKLFDLILEFGFDFAFGMGSVSAAEIDAYGLTWANKEIWHRALLDLFSKVSKSSISHTQPFDIKIDGTKKDLDHIIPSKMKSRIKETSFEIDGDDRFIEISLASIVAKVSRDRMMRSLDNENPNYGFAKHKGYGTKLHQTALQKYGASQWHRRSYTPVQKVAIKHQQDPYPTHLA